VTLREHLRAWRVHAALNAGAALRCAWHIVVPPQLDHARGAVESLSSSTARGEFARALGWTRDKGGAL